MAKKVYIEELWIGVKADISGLMNNMALSATAIKRWSSKISALSGRLREFGKATLFVSGAFSLLGTIMVRTFAKFEQSMANTFSVLSATGKEMQNLTDYAREMGNTTIFTASQAGDAMYYLASAGFNAEKTIKSLGGTLALAAATQHDLAETTRIVVQTLNAYRLEAESASRVANVFSGIISTTQATMDRLRDSMKFVAPTAAIMGVSIEQLSSMMGILFNAGLEASQAGVYLRQAFLRLQAPVPKATEAIKKMGLTLQEVSPQVNSFVEILNKFKEAGGDTKEFADEMKDIFGLRAITAMQILVRAGGDELANLTDRITDTNKAFEMQEIQINTLHGSWLLLKSALQETSIGFGTMLQPIIKSFTDSITRVVRAFNTMNPTLRKIILLVPTFATVIGLVVGSFSLLLSLLPKIIGYFKLIGVLAGTISGPIVLATAAVTGLVFAITSLVSASNRRKKQLDESIKTMKDEINQTVSVKQRLFDLVSIYLDLANKKNKSTEESENMLAVENRIKAIYPEILKNVSLHSEKVRILEQALMDLSSELDTLYTKQKRIRILELQIDISEAKNNLNDIKKDMTEVGFFEGLGEALSDQINIASEDMNTLNLKTEDFITNYGKLATGKAITLPSGGLLGSFERAFSKGKLDINDISEDLSKMGDLLDSLTVSWQDLITKQETLKSDGKDITAEEQKTLMVVENRRNNLTELITTYATFVKQIVDVESKEVGLLNLEKQLSELQKLKLSDMKKIKTTLEELLGSQNDLNEEDAEAIALQKKKLSLISKINMAILREQLEAVKNANAKSLGDKIDNEMKAFRIKKKMLQLEKSEALKAANQLGISTLKTEELFQLKLSALKKEHYQNHADILKDFSENERMLLENRMEYEAEMSEVQAERYIAFLQNKLLSTEEWGDKYIEILEKIMGWERKLWEDRYDFAIKTNEVLSESIGAGWNKMWEEVIKELDITYLRISNLFDGIAKSFLKMINQMIADYIASGIFKILMGLLNSITGGIGGNVAGQVASAISSASGSSPGGYPGQGLVPSAAVGATVTKSGLAKVHKEETIVPAYIKRETRETFSKKMGATKGNMISNISNNFNLNNPIVDDETYWEQFYENVFLKVSKKYNARTGIGYSG